MELAGITLLRCHVIIIVSGAGAAGKLGHRPKHLPTALTGTRVVKAGFLKAVREAVA